MATIPSDVLQSFEIQDTLNPDIWTPDMRIKPDIRKRLLVIAKSFYEDLELGGAKLHDVTLTGSISNFNWSKFSDIDLHLRIRFSEVDENEELVRNLVQAKKTVWNQKHDIKIKGFPVEVYVENVGESHVASGLYSILRDEWLVKPEKAHLSIDKEDIASKATGFVGYLKTLQKWMDIGKYDDVIAGVKKIQNKLKRMRQAGLESGGEYSVENLAFKALRRSPFIAQIVDLRQKAYDKAMSMDEMLTEAHPVRDKVLRTVANDAHKKVLRFISSPSNFKRAVHKRGKVYSLYMKSVNSDWNDLRVVISPETSSVGGGFSENGDGAGKHVLYLNIISSIGSADGPPHKRIPRYFKFSKGTFVHEFTHYLDFVKRGAKSTYDKNDVDKFVSGKDLTKYVNSPGEFNAFYQQGANKVEDWVKEALRKPEIREIMPRYIPQQLNDFVKLIFSGKSIFWPTQFTNTLDSRYKRKFIKRVAPLHKWAVSKLYENMEEAAERDYKEEYRKYQSSPAKKKYRAELNKYNRDRGTYGNGDGQDASHKNGKIAGFESESKNRGRAEKSRLKGSKRKKS